MREGNWEDKTEIKKETGIREISALRKRKKSTLYDLTE